MRLTRTPAQHHDYNIKLTREELISLAGEDVNWKLFDDLYELIEREAEKIGNSASESGQGE